MEWDTILALAIAAVIVLFPAAFIWYINLGKVYAGIQGAIERRKARILKKAIPRQTCSVNADCPRGHVCLDGLCVPHEAQ